MENKTPLAAIAPHHQRILGFLVALIILLGLVGVVLGVVIYNQQRQSADLSQISDTDQSDLDNIEPARRPPDDTLTASVTWQQTENGWQASGTPPACPTPLITSPIDTSQVTSILYPGQTRGDNYKPHGGFRFDTITDNQVIVRVPLDAVVVDGARYLVEGETQYTFDFVAPCGMMYRLGHLLTLDPQFQAIADQFSEPKEGDSRTTRVEPNIVVRSGDLIATAVGVTKGQNTFFDFGVYNLQTKNEISQDPTWAASHDPSLAPYAVCWFDLLPAADTAKVKSLPPADYMSGKTSDYCK